MRHPSCWHLRRDSDFGQAFTRRVQIITVPATVRTLLPVAYMLTPCNTSPGYWFTPGAADKFCLMTILFWPYNDWRTTPILSHYWFGINYFLWGLVWKAFGGEVHMFHIYNVFIISFTCRCGWQQWSLRTTIHGRLHSSRCSSDDVHGITFKHQYDRSTDRPWCRAH